jgi:hypothetical protein
MLPMLVVSVPADDCPDLAELSAALGQPAFDPVELRPFDGQTLVQLVVSLGGGGAAIRVLEVWLRERAKIRKNSWVRTEDGIVISGADVKGIERILKAARQRTK